MAASPHVSPASVVGIGISSALNGISASDKRPSPTIPPSPEANGQDAGTGQLAKHAADKGTVAVPISQRRMRGAPISTARMDPPTIRAMPAAQLDQPSVCLAASEKTAPAAPKRLLTPEEVAAFQLGSVGT